MKHTLSVLVEDESGALSRISGLFARRGFNIESLAVGPAEGKGVSRLTMVVEGDQSTLQQMTKQLNKLVNVLNVIDLTTIPSVERELMLVKVSAPPERRSEILELMQVFRANVIDVSNHALILEVVGIQASWWPWSRFSKVTEFSRSCAPARWPWSGPQA